MYFYIDLKEKVVSISKYSNRHDQTVVDMFDHRAVIDQGSGQKVTFKGQKVRLSSWLLGYIGP